MVKKPNCLNHSNCISIEKKKVKKNYSTLQLLIQEVKRETMITRQPGDRKENYNITNTLNQVPVLHVVPVFEDAQKSQ